MRIVALDRVARRETPAVRSVAFEPKRVADAVSVINAGMSDILLPIVRVSVAEPARIDAAEGIVGKKERSPRVGSERKLDALETASVDELAALDPAFVIGFSHHRIARRRSGQNISNEALVPATDRMVQCEAVGRAPVPREGGSSALSVPIPLRFAPEIGDAVTNAFLLRRIAIEIGARTQESLKQERALDQIGAIVLPAERLCRAGVAVHEMGVEAVIAGRPLEAVQRLRQASEHLGSRHPSALAGYDHRHHAKAGTPSRDDVICGICQPSRAIARKSARRLGAVPKEQEGLALD